MVIRGTAASRDDTYAAKTVTALPNPWTELPATPPFVLADDAIALGRYGAAGVHTEVLPCPYLGSPATARVYLLNLNPAYSPAVAAFTDPHYSEEVRRGLIFASTYPFWAFDPSLAASPGHHWWATLTLSLRARVRIDKLASRMMCLQWFPYHSASAADLTAITQPVPSQSYTFQLLRDAIGARGLVLVLRSERLWLSSVPELASVDYLRVTNVRRPFLSPGNMPGDGFERLVAALE